MTVSKKTIQVAQAIREAVNIDRVRQCQWDRLARTTQGYYLRLAKAAIAALKTKED